MRIASLFSGFVLIIGRVVFSSSSGNSGCVCFIRFHSSVVLHAFPFAPLFASSSAASLPMSLLCPLICSNLIVLLLNACCKRFHAIAAKYLLLWAVYSPVIILAAYFES